MANVFYIIIAVLQTIPLISITGGKPIMLIPLTFVISVSMIKDIIEDYKRHKSDRKENMS
jgi:phospholipid-transporting ATPase